MADKKRKSPNHGPLERFFARNASTAGLCIYDPVFSAEFVKKGELISYQSNGETHHQITAQNGFLVQEGQNQSFYSEGKFRLLFMPLIDVISETKRINLPEQWSAEYVEAGQYEEIHLSNRAERTQLTQIEENGWIIEDRDKKRRFFMDDVHFRLLYRTDWPHSAELKTLYKSRTPENQIDVPFVRLDRDVHYRDEMDIPHIAYKGSYLIVLPLMPREYHVVNERLFFRGFSITEPHKDPLTPIKTKILKFPGVK